MHFTCRLPAVFFEKYWYLTTDYTLERTSQRWRQLKSMVANETELETATDQLQQQQPWEDRQRTNDLMAMMHPPVYSNTNDPAHYPDYDIPSYEFTGPSHTNPPPPPWNQSYPYVSTTNSKKWLLTCFIFRCDGLFCGKYSIYSTVEEGCRRDRSFIYN